MKTVKVVAAVICDSIKEKKLIFATARGYGESRVSGNSLVEKLSLERLLKRPLLEK